MFTISEEELSERVRAFLSVSLHEHLLPGFRLIGLHEDNAGEGTAPTSEFVIALVQYQEPGTRNVFHAGVLIDYANEWPLAVALEKDEMRISPDASCLFNIFRGPYGNETGSYTVSQVRDPSGNTAVVLTKRKGLEYFAFDRRPRFLTAV